MLVNSIVTFFITLLLTFSALLIYKKYYLRRIKKINNANKYAGYIEREKYSYIFKEYIAETLSSIRVRLEVLNKDIKQNTKNNEEIILFIDTSIKNITNLSRLIEFEYSSEKTLKDNLNIIFKEYERNYNININFKEKGVVNNLSITLNKLIVETAKDLLYIVKYYNLCNDININLLNRLNYITLIFKFKASESVDTLTVKESGLSYYLLKSLKNKINTVNGKLKLKNKSKGKVVFVVFIPLKNMLESEVMYDEDSITK